MSYKILVIEGAGLKSKFLDSLRQNMTDLIITIARSGTEAVELLKLDSFDMLLSSLTIPGMDGVQFLRKVAASRQWPALAIVDQASRRIMVSVNLAARDLGFTVVGFVTRPADVQDLRVVHQKCAGLVTAVQARNSLPEAPGEDRIELRFKARRNLHSGRITAVKAVALWPSSDGFPASASNKFNEKYLAQVVSQVIAAQHAWQQAGCKVSVWIKLPIALLTCPDFAERMHRCVIRHGGEPESIGFELTKTGEKEHLIHHIESIYQLRFKGFAVAHDDDGQGYRSFLNLKLMPFTDIRIFSSLVRSAVKNQKMASALACIISESHQLGLTVTADGVETQEELSLLRHLYCDEAQGPLICEAVDRETLARLLQYKRLENI